MKTGKTSGYRNYGSTPRNEYTTRNKKSTNSAEVSEQTSQADDMVYKRRLLSRQAQHPSGKRQSSGWLRSRSTNGWRSELASQLEEVTLLSR